MKQAMGMILTGRRVPAAEGFELGFVTEVVPEGQALAAAKRWAAHDPGMLADGGAGVEAGGVSRAGRADLEPAMRTVYPAQQENIDKPGLHRRPERVRREAQAELAEQVAVCTAPDAVAPRFRGLDG